MFTIEVYTFIEKLHLPLFLYFATSIKNLGLTTLHPEQKFLNSNILTPDLVTQFSASNYPLITSQIQKES